MASHHHHSSRGRPAPGPAPRPPRSGSARPLAAALAVLALAAGLRAQAGYVVGEATAVDPDAGTLTVKADAGDLVGISLVQGATLLRAKPGAKDLVGASPITLHEIRVGDRVMLRGVPSEDRSALQARQVVVMARDDIAQKRDAERAEWRRRGVLGVVTGLELATGEITLRPARSRRGEAPLVIATADRPVVFRRYAPDSVKFSDARPSALKEVRLGDEVRALGERSPDSNVFLAEQVVFGTFRLVSGTLRGVDPGRNEVTLTDEDSRVRITVAVGPEARLRRLPPEVAGRLAARRDREGEDGRPSAAPLPRPRPTAPGPEDLLDTLPSISLTDLKPGDRILVSSTKGADPLRLNAIALLAGLEALMPPPSRSRAGRGPDAGLPPELMDLGMSVQ